MLHSNGFDSENSHKQFELPGARPHYTPDRPGQVEHISLDLTLDLPNRSFWGRCMTRLNPIRDGITRLTLDAVNLTIESVKIGEVDGEGDQAVEQKFDYDGEQIQVFLAEPTQTGKGIELAIAYRADHPQRGIYFIAPNEHYPDKPIQVWTQGEDEDSRFWFPCFDYPGQLATSEIRVCVPKQYLAISNGELVNTEADDESATYHWRQNEVHPTYLMTLAVGDFAELKDEWNGKPVTYYVEKGREQQARLSMSKTPQMIEFFSQKYGYPYPFPKYAQVCVDDFIFGGMENTSTTLLTDRCLLDERAAIDNLSTESLVAHELAHQWFGDLVVIKHWSHAWVKEGMASYAEVMWVEKEYGADDAAYYLLGQAQEYLDEDSSRYRRSLVTHVYREAIELYDRHIYEKGSCVYHMIRKELGDELFYKTISTFLSDNAHRTVETVDLLRAIEKTTGRNLMFLFDQYVYRGGHPDYKVAYGWDADSSLAKVTVTQSQTELFDLKLAIAVGYLQADAAPMLKPFTVRVYEKEQSFYFPLEKKPDFVSFDVGNGYLKTVALDYPFPELKAQLQADPDPISRLYAAEAIAKKGGLEAVNVLSEALQKEGFWGVRAYVVRSLSTIKLDQAVKGVLAGLRDENAKVRRATVESLAHISTDESYQALKAVVEQGDASYYVEAAALRSLGRVAAAGSDDVVQAADVLQVIGRVLQQRQGWNEVVRAGAIAALSQLKTSEAALNLILEYTQPGIPQPLRLAAIRSLGAISTGQTNVNVERILERLNALSRETFFLSQVAVAIALGQMETVHAIGVLQALANQTPDGRVRRIAEESIQTVQKTVGTDKAVKQLREDLDQLKKENQDLKSRLEMLEAKSSASPR
ncbi:M1 family metallopeptidase [Myxacorys almedinensis]|uniref:Aminopeptidase N n=1 Tax=Myxacorys almedinensis A TaxID=2690445 RepID=A0A8J8CP08_9CYAN|nr:M1 family metallopeptidase [Myxacorys almedinensis]NDJ18992.1 aminopeptidase [Myxacorys almedinensis A]